MKRVLLLISLMIGPAYALDEVRVLPLAGPLGSAKISPANGSATAYRMDYPGQRSICFKSFSETDVFISSSTTEGTNGFPLTTSGDSVCLDLAGGTTVYFYGDGASADIRAIFAR